ncbi:hypothetical protein IQ235_13465 [Oscillatoriales cyanobacterium LEGE 11467]|uniref:Uncharacterized protein n=1 Tax=Zarconia navalis LEGE 11467 TaxID=1828826 RepID=A0A928VY60_9CYAN|nr:hypothetical protein [Zarconia navalis]MBE9041789.1 hypothetical protein [Zarconia navalis LEGE 11467]
MLRDALKQEIDRLSESQLKRIAEFITLVKHQTQQVAIDVPFWKSATPAERSQDFRAWVERLPKTGSSLSDEAFDRGSIYE